MEGRTDVAVALSVVVGAVLIAAAIGVGGWPGAASGCIAAAECSCEAFTGGIVEQPLNTISNLGFVAVGVWALSRTARADERRSLLRLIAGITVFIGLGSGLFHASTREWGGWLDLVGVAALFSFVAVHELGLLLGRSSRWAIAAFGAVMAPLGIALWSLDKGAGKYVLAPVLAAAVLFTWLVIRRRIVVRDARWLWAAGGVSAAGVVLMELSRTGGPWCFADTAWQVHGLWHLAAAAAIGLLYRYFETGAVTRE